MNGEVAVETLDVSSFPEMDAKRRYESLVGLEDHKSRLAKQIAVVFTPTYLHSWVKRFGNEKLAQIVRNRPPLFIFAGDVGCGKTELAETLGDAVARNLDIGVKLYRLALTTRGSGLVGEMTKLISTAFARVRTDAQSWRAANGDARVGAILFIDEADSLGESRETAEMHHEDRVGVNALIRGINDLARADPPVVVVMATNRPDSLDMGIVRRAADILIFDRPGDAHRRLVLNNALCPPLDVPDIDTLVRETGVVGNRPFGYTYSDLTQRLIPNIVIAALPNSRIDMPLVQRILEQTPPTKPFRSEAQPAR
ncbi:MAG TPA: ATP-binding protein [Candidatus Tumulicola sp.]|nr:ATP-binding protein [Candidatus Tumulicola sp.]